MSDVYQDSYGTPRKPKKPKPPKPTAEPVEPVSEPAPDDTYSDRY